MEINNREMTDQITNVFLNEIKENSIVSDIPKYDYDRLNALTERVEELLSEIHDEVNNISTMRIQYYRPLTAFHVFFSFVTINIKRIIRKFLRFLIEPIVNETEQYRTIMEKTTMDLLEIVEIQNVEIVELRKELQVIKTSRLGSNKDENNSDD